MKILNKILFWLKMEFGDTFFRIQKLIFSIFIIGEISGVIIQGIANGNAGKDILTFSMKIFSFWIITVFILVILWVLGKRVADLDLLFEYYIWIPHVVPRVGKLFRLYPNDQLDLLELVRKSYSYEKRCGKPCPVFIKRAHLERKRFWPHWEFSIVVINQPGKVKIIVRNSRAHSREKRWEMIVNLLDESFGIYNNAGKRFLRENFSNPHIHESMAQASKKCYEIQDPQALIGSSLSWGDTNERLPLRWASGGFLPIIEHRQKEWAMFFFRDILPIGLNIANGASEKKNEYKELHRLIGREFAEEVILLTGTPYSGSNISQQRFTQDEFNPNLSRDICEYINPEFSKVHNMLRFEHDNITIKLLDNEDGCPITSVKTPFRISVRYHSPSIKTSIEGQYNRNMIFLVNPFEFGLEAVWISKFELKDEEYILDGEYDLGRNYLIRQPVILLGIDYLKSIFVKEKSLGKASDIGESKVLPIIPKGEFIIFTQDIDLRKRRLETIRNLISTRTSKNIDNLIYEENRINKWLNDYELAFRQSVMGDLEFTPFRTLCPVAWKVLELSFAHQII